jgi:hypothetical protein
MIQATARVLKNVIEIKVGDELWLARPVQWTEEGLGSRIAALFSTEYYTYRPSAPEQIHSTVDYRVKGDAIRISIGDDHWQTKSSTFGPITVEYGGRKYIIHERLTGRFAIVEAERPVGVGQTGFRSCAINDYPPELEGFFANLALGFLIRTLTWEGLR